MPYVRNTIKVKVPAMSGFDKSHRNTGTSKVGTITPILCDEVIPKSRVKLRLPISLQLPPLASDTYMNCKLRVEAFFIPSRLLCRSFEDFFCDNGLSSDLQAPSFVVYSSDVKPRVPFFNFQVGTAGLNLPYLDPGSLADYLGIRASSGSNIQATRINALPFIAYWLVWQEYYRNPRVQRPAFRIPSSISRSDFDEVPCACLPSLYFGSDESGTLFEGNINITSASAANTHLLLANGHNIFDLAQRNFGQDYFTGARLKAQQGDAVSLAIDELPSGDEGFTIAQLRSANSLQQFRERNNLASPRLVDQVKSRYGANLSDGVAQRPICIGTASYDVASVGISQTGEVSEGANPFNSVAAQYGRAGASGSDFIIDDFVANEPGYILVNQTLVPEVSYTYGTDPMFRRYLTNGSVVEMANPLLQNIGDQPIYKGELLNAKVGDVAYDSNNVFGFTDRFADFMFKPNTIHGEMRGTLSSFVAQRTINSAQLSTDFLEIPTDYLDNIFAVSSGVSNIGYWYDAYLDYKVSMPLAEYSIPSLQDPAYEHGDSVLLHRNGQIF